MSNSLLRVLGAAFALAVLVGNAIGVGILRTPGEVAAQVATTPLFMAVWVAGGVYALLGALCVAELAAMRPRSGGLYPLVHRVLGPFPGFVVGWTDWVATCGSTAAVAIVLGEYVAPLHSSMAGHEGTLAGSVVALFALVQWRGIRVGNLVQQVTSLLKGVALAAVAAAAFVLVDGTVAASVDVTADSGRTGILAAAAFVVALQSAIFTYDGWTAPIYFGQELSDPARDIPRAMIWGVLLVLAIYLALNAAFITVVPLNEMAGDPFVAATVMRRLFGLQGEAVLRVVMLVSLLASVNALMLMASRVPFAMSEDRLLPPVAGRVNAGGTPVAGLLLSTGITQAFIATNAFNTVLAMLAFLFVASYVVTFAALFVSRRREPQAPRPFRVPWYPLVPGVALGGSVAFLGAALVSDPRHSLMAVALVALSWPLYRVQRVGHPIPQKEHA